MADGDPEIKGPGEVKVDTDVPKWIKILGALVGIASVIAGLWFSAYQLRMKAEADRETARLNLKAEENKLKLGEDQIKAQNDQHTADNGFEKEKHGLDTKQQKDQAAAAELKEERAGLSAVINKMFSDTTSEGDIASLFEYIHHDAASREVVKNAVLAKLENPKSPEEIDLGFRVLEAIGPSSLDSVVRANCEARRKYDAKIVQEYGTRVYAKITEEANKSKQFPAIGRSFVDEVSANVADETSLNHEYVFALINTTFSTSFVFPQKLFARITAEAKKENMEFELAEDVITRSNLAMSRVLRGYKSKRGDFIQLSTAYISSRITSDEYFNWLPKRARCEGCFVDFDELLPHFWQEVIHGSKVIETVKGPTLPTEGYRFHDNP